MNFTYRDVDITVDPESGEFSCTLAGLRVTLPTLQGIKTAIARHSPTVKIALPIMYRDAYNYAKVERRIVTHTDVSGGLVCDGGWIINSHDTRNVFVLDEQTIQQLAECDAAIEQHFAEVGEIRRKINDIWRQQRSLSAWDVETLMKVATRLAS